MVSFTPRLLYSRGKSPSTHWIGGWVGHRAGLEDMEKREFFTLPRLEIRPLGRNEDVWGEWMYRSSFLTTALVGGEWSASCPCHFTTEERAPGTH
jgi:hypothetical protein